MAIFTNANPVPTPAAPKAVLAYAGERDALRAEIGLLDCYTDKFQLAAFGPNGEEFTPEGARNITELRALVREWRNAYPDMKVAWL